MDEPTSLSEMTTDIVSAFVSNNVVALSELPGLIQSIHATLRTIGEPVAEPVEASTKATAAQIRKSITAEALISFEDGKPYKTLKRHLTKRGLTIAEYKAKWGLPNDYPSTAPSYSERRSAMAKSLGLGNKRVSAPKKTTRIKA